MQVVVRHRKATVTANKQSLVTKAAQWIKPPVLISCVNLKQGKLTRPIPLYPIFKVKVPKHKYQTCSRLHKEEQMCLRNAKCVWNMSNIRFQALRVDLYDLPLVANDTIYTALEGNSSGELNVVVDDVPAWESRLADRHPW